CGVHPLCEIAGPAPGRLSHVLVDAEAETLVETLCWIPDRDGERPLRFPLGREAVAAADDERRAETSVTPLRDDQREHKEEMSTVAGHHGRADGTVVGRVRQE